MVEALPQPIAVATAMPTTSPIAQPVKQCSVAWKAVRVSGSARAMIPIGGMVASGYDRAARAARRGDDLRLVRGPGRALAERPGRGARRPSTTPPSGRRSPTTRAPPASRASPPPIESAGYHAVLPSHPRRPDAEATRTRLRLAAAAVLSAPVVLLAMVPALRFGGWEWVAAALTTPVVLWAGAPFHRAAWRALRHGTRDDGHAGLDRDVVRLGVVAGRAAARRRRDLLRGRRPS